MLPSGLAFYHTGARSVSKDWHCRRRFIGVLSRARRNGPNADGLRCKSQIETCISTAAEYIGAEALLEQLPATIEESIDKSLERRGDDDDVQDEEDMDIDDESDGSRLWLVPLLRRSLTGANVFLRRVCVTERVD